LDVYENDLSLVLLDQRGQVRGRYQVFNTDPDLGALAVENFGGMSASS
jgi:hypothetical protein